MSAAVLCGVLLLLIVVRPSAMLVGRLQVNIVVDAAGTRNPMQLPHLQVRHGDWPPLVTALIPVSSVVAGLVPVRAIVPWLGLPAFFNQSALLLLLSQRQQHRGHPIHVLLC